MTDKFEDWIRQEDAIRREEEEAATARIQAEERRKAEDSPVSPTYDIRVGWENDGNTETLVVAGVEALQARFSYGLLPTSGFTISSEVYDEPSLAAGLPSLSPLVTREQDDHGRELVDFPLGDEGTVLAHATVNGNSWAYVVLGEDSAWLPAPFFERPDVETVYEVWWTSEGGAEHGDTVHSGPGVAVQITVDSHFDSMTGGIEEATLWPGGIEGFDVEALPLPDQDEDDPLESLTISIPSLDGEQSKALLARLATTYGADAYITVNDISAPIAERRDDDVARESCGSVHP